MELGGEFSTEVFQVLDGLTRDKSANLNTSVPPSLPFNYGPNGSCNRFIDDDSEMDDEIHEPSITSPVNIENLALDPCVWANSNIESAKLTGGSHLSASPYGPAGTVGVLVLPVSFLQQIGFVQFVSEPGCRDG